MNQLLDYSVFFRYTDMDEEDDDVVFSCQAVNEEDALEKFEKSEPKCIATRIVLDSDLKINFKK